MQKYAFCLMNFIWKDIFPQKIILMWTSQIMYFFPTFLTTVLVQCSSIYFENRSHEEDRFHFILIKKQNPQKTQVVIR